MTTPPAVPRPVLVAAFTLGHAATTLLFATVDTITAVRDRARPAAAFALRIAGDACHHAAQRIDPPTSPTGCGA